MSFYDINEDLLRKTITNFAHYPNKILIQFPDGLLGETFEKVVKLLDEYGIESIIAADPSYGACDLPISLAEILKIDIIFHFGHSTFAFPPPKEFHGKIYYFPVEANVKIDWQAIKNEIIKLNWKKIGLLVTIQHINLFAEATKAFEDANIVVRQHKEGQILGCNQDRAVKIMSDVDGFLVIAGGDFHASPVVVTTNKPTVRYDPFNGSFKVFDHKYRQKYLAKRFAMIEKARSANNWGILLSAKSGQLSRDHGNRLKLLLERNGRKAKIFLMHRIDLNHLINFETIDAWVITLCPRIATDDYVNINKPILTSREVSVVVGDLDWEKFIFPSSEEHFLTIEEFE
ncbi:MAG: diphthamide biosynthesis enzyme Dph2 [Candidatus Thorarchaeota archaeon]